MRRRINAENVGTTEGRETALVIGEHRAEMFLPPKSSPSEVIAPINITPDLARLARENAQLAVMIALGMVVAGTAYWYATHPEIANASSSHTPVSIDHDANLHPGGVSTDLGCNVPQTIRGPLAPGTVVLASVGSTLPNTFGQITAGPEANPDPKNQMCVFTANLIGIDNPAIVHKGAKLGGENFTTVDGTTVWVRAFEKGQWARKFQAVLTGEQRAENGKTFVELKDAKGNPIGEVGLEAVSPLPLSTTPSTGKGGGEEVEKPVVLPSTLELNFGRRDLEVIDEKLLISIINRAYSRVVSILGEPTERITISRSYDPVCQPACAFPNRVSIHSTLDQEWISGHSKDLEDYFAHEFAHAVVYGWDYLSSQGIAETVNRITSGANPPEERDFGPEHAQMVKSIRAFMKLEREHPGLLKQIKNSYVEWRKTSDVKQQETAGYFMPESLAKERIERFKKGLWSVLLKEIGASS